jgi:hypothetical protein
MKAMMDLTRLIPNGKGAKGSSLMLVVGDKKSNYSSYGTGDFPLAILVILFLHSLN